MSQWKEALLITVAMTIPAKYLKQVPEYVVDGTKIEEISERLKEDSE